MTTQGKPKNHAEKTSTVGMEGVFGGLPVDEYMDVQAKYRGNLRESDKLIIAEILRFLEDRPTPGPPAVLDVGCSTANLLHGIKQRLPNARLTGWDVFSESIARCKGDPELTGIEFATMDIRKVDGIERRFDIITVSAVFYWLGEADFRRALENVYRLLGKGGMLVCFDLFNPFEQNLTVIETSERTPDGVRLIFRPYSFVRSVLTDCGFVGETFKPFHMPLDLAKPGSADDLSSYTIAVARGPRLCFRGALAQPWCHLIARKGDG